MTENNAELSRRGFFESALGLFTSLAIPSSPRAEEKKNPSSEGTDQAEIDELSAYIEYMRLASLKMYLENESNPNKTVLRGQRVVEWKYPGNKTDQKFFSRLGLENYVIKGKPIYVVKSDSFMAVDGPSIMLMAQNTKALYDPARPENPNPLSGIVRTAGGDQGEEEIYTLYDEAAIINTREARNLSLEVPDKGAFDSYLNSLGHRLGFDLQAW